MIELTAVIALAIAIPIAMLYLFERKPEPVTKTITVNITADTTEFNMAIERLNSSIDKFQQGLREVSVEMSLSGREVETLEKYIFDSMSSNMRKW